MTREIKFRAWEPTRKEMLSYNGIFNSPDIRFNTKLLMQFTGLFDRLGKEIYEGDILQNVFYQGKRIKKVEWRNNGQTINGWNVAIGDIWEVIGNIWENPELLPPN